MSSASFSAVNLNFCSPAWLWHKAATTSTQRRWTQVAYGAVCAAAAAGQSIKVAPPPPLQGHLRTSDVLQPTTTGATQKAEKPSHNRHLQLCSSGADAWKDCAAQQCGIV